MTTYIFSNKGTIESSFINFWLPWCSVRKYHFLTWCQKLINFPSPPTKMLPCRCKDVGDGIPARLAPRLPCHGVLIDQKAALSAGSVFIFADEQRCQVMEEKSLLDSPLESAGSSHLPPVRQGLGAVWRAVWVAQDMLFLDSRGRIPGASLPPPQSLTLTFSHSRSTRICYPSLAFWILHYAYWAKGLPHSQWASAERTSDVWGGDTQGPWDWGTSRGMVGGMQIEFL